MSNQKITFSFGKNWQSYLTRISESQIKDSIQDIIEWVKKENIVGKKILDIGSGSGIHSLAFYKLGVKEVVSFDLDSASVEATRSLWIKTGKPSCWKIFKGSILDKEFLENLDQYDMVYSWGVLHHTGKIWEAIKNAAILVKDSGFFLISIYVKGPNYIKHLQLKKKYNNSSFIGKKLMEIAMILERMYNRIKHHQNPLKWNEQKKRGMDTYHDIVDWLGGLPYEVASTSEVISFCKKLGFNLIRLKEATEGGCNVYLFQKS